WLRSIERDLCLLGHSAVLRLHDRLRSRTQADAVLVDGRQGARPVLDARSDRRRDRDLRPAQRRSRELAVGLLLRRVALAAVSDGPVALSLALDVVRPFQARLTLREASLGLGVLLDTKHARLPAREVLRRDVAAPHSQ